ncbi:hypothetical protein SK3146_04879 [Paenibacillus konkukensis]|uniref:Uncharacterized protein n=1 Tax=Paenibacillus konkukensis TaxID=2020716 RepID=A0ABY4RTP1_9BACL|nr:hypothetical protein [Paenibacillus konkukensis]UQZ85590.1 hypothetical protein SK3146_04879 [Paenibacillus konkukensis]
MPANKALHHKRTRVVYTTGILRRNPRTKYALVDCVNLGKHSRRVTVQVLDWSSGSPVPLKVSPCRTTRCTVTVGPRQSVFLFADVSKVAFKYEVRITQSADRTFVTNVYGVTKTTFKPLEGGTVLQRDLVKLRTFQV